MQYTNPEEAQRKVALRYRTMMTLWVAMFMSVVMYYILSRLAGPPQAGPSKNVMLSVVLTVVGGVSALISHLMKFRYVNRAAEEHRIELVQTGMIIGLALTEIAPLLGLLDCFMNADPYYHLLFVLGGASMLLHFPRRENLVAAL